MNSRDFCYWLQGFFELRGDNAPIDLTAAATIARHLALVFVHDAGLQAPECPKASSPPPLSQEAAGMFPQQGGLSIFDNSTLSQTARC